MQRLNAGFKKKIQNTADIEIMTGAQYAALMTEDGGIVWNLRMMPVMS